MPPRATCLALSCLLASTALSGAASSLLGSSGRSIDDGGLSALRAVAVDHPDKVPIEFSDRLVHRHADGSLLLLVAVPARTPAVEAFASAHSLGARWLADAGFLARATPAQAADLIASPLVSFVEPDYALAYLLSESTVEARARSVGSAGTGVWSFDPASGTMGALASDVAGVSTPITGANVAVAVIDSGIDRTHRDFGGWDCVGAPYEPCDSRIVATVVVDHLVEGLVEEPRLPTTELVSGHGTHVAGIIAGNAYSIRNGDADPRYGEGDDLVIGVAPEAKLVSVKSGDSLSAGLATSALAWTLEHADELHIRVASNSWGCLSGCAFDPASLTSQILRDLYEAGVVVVFAAGNGGGSGTGTGFSGFAQSPYVLAVANYDDATHQLDASSSRGAQTGGNTLPDAANWTPESEGTSAARRPDLAAPGVAIYSAATLTGGTSSGTPRLATSDVTGGDNFCCFIPYRQISGTSMSAPHVSGAAALLLDACEDATPLDVMRALMVGANATRVLKTGTAVLAEPFETGHGALDARASLDWLFAQPACAPASVVNEAPIAEVDAPARAPAGTVVTFDGSGSRDLDGRIVEWVWDLGDGTVEHASIVEHTYKKPGSMRVTLAVTDDRGATSVVWKRHVVQGPPA